MNLNQTFDIRDISIKIENFCSIRIRNSETIIINNLYLLHLHTTRDLSTAFILRITISISYI